MAASRASTPTLLVDTNVILDVILKRAPWAEEGVLILDAVARGAARGFVAGHAVTTVHYIVEREVGLAAANTAVSDLLQLLTVVALDGADFQRALALGLEDYEDAVRVAAYLKIGADYLVTRNARDYRRTPVTVLSSGEVLALIRAGQE